MKSFHRHYHWVLIDLPEIIFHIQLITCASAPGTVHELSTSLWWSIDFHPQAAEFLCLRSPGHWRVFRSFAVGQDFWAFCGSWKQPSAKDYQFPRHLTWDDTQPTRCPEKDSIHSGSLLGSKPLIGFLLYPNSTFSMSLLTFWDYLPNKLLALGVCF